MKTLARFRRGFLRETLVGKRHFCATFSTMSMQVPSNPNHLLVTTPPDPWPLRVPSRPPSIEFSEACEFLVTISHSSCHLWERPWRELSPSQLDACFEHGWLRLSGLGYPTRAPPPLVDPAEQLLPRSYKTASPNCVPATAPGSSSTATQ